MGKPKPQVEKETLSVKVAKYKIEYLRAHCKLTGNKLSEIIDSLIDYYMFLDTEAK